MKLSQLVSPERIHIGWPESFKEKQKNKWNLIEDSVNRISESLAFVPEQRDVALNLVLEREESMTTGIGEGVALPHASLEFLKSMIASMTIFPEGIDFESIDRKPVYIYILILVPKNQFQKHIRTLASIARLMNDTSFRNEIITRESPQDIYDFILTKEKD